MQERASWPERTSIARKELNFASIYDGDEVRLKFLYPNGQLEILDCTWISTATLGENGDVPQREWVVVRHQGKVIWKPMVYLMQIEVLNPMKRSGTS